MDLSEFAVVPEPTAERLSQRQRVDYRTEREDAIKWLLAFGIDPKKANGYAESTVQNRIYRMDQFDRYVWDAENRYTTAVTYDHAHNARLDSELYGQRWMAETAFSAIKRRFGPAVHPRARYREFRELVLTAAVYNLEQALKQ